jgi:PEGA domain-containing protein
MKVSGLVVCLLVAIFATAQEPTTTNKPRVFVTDSQSWEISGSGGGANGAWGAQTHGGARPQTAEIIKTFGERCPQVMVNNKQDNADYIVLLDHEGGKGWIRHDNKVAVFQKASGDVVISHSTLSLGGSVKDACEGIAKDWSEHGAQIRAASTKTTAPQVVEVSAKSTPVPASSGPKISVASTPGGADIEIDGNFVGSTPSVIEMSPGDHTVLVRKSGYRPWARKMKVSGGEIHLDAELEKQ